MKLLTEKQEERERRSQRVVDVFKTLTLNYPENSVSSIISHMARNITAGYRSQAGIRKVLLRAGVDVTRNRKQA